MPATFPPIVMSIFSPYQLFSPPFWLPLHAFRALNFKKGMKILFFSPTNFSIPMSSVQLFFLVFFFFLHKTWLLTATNVCAFGFREAQLICNFTFAKYLRDQESNEKKKSIYSLVVYIQHVQRPPFESMTMTAEYNWLLNWQRNFFFLAFRNFATILAFDGVNAEKSITNV